VEEIRVDLADDRFDLTFDADQVSLATLVETIRDLDYKPEVVDAPGALAAVAERIDLELLPEEMQAVFVEAKLEKKFVLVEFSGPG